MAEIGVGMLGYAFMGKAHSNAYRQVNKFFPDLDVTPVLKALCGRSEDRVRPAAEGTPKPPPDVRAVRALGLLEEPIPGDLRDLDQWRGPRGHPTRR